MDVEREHSWKVALYIRLSREDGGDESLSVTNQRKLLQDFLMDGFQGKWTLTGEFVDDGVSRTDDQRPAFQRMLRMIEAGQVDCVVCKNLSRAFRNYADQGYFLERYFPLTGTRFVTLGDPKVDSYLQPEGVLGLEVPISGLMNDRYAAKTSCDIRKTLDAKRKRGEYIGAFAPYGYRKSEDDKNRLEPDPEAARVVTAIFQWYGKEGLSRRAIVRRLNEQGIPNPTRYKQLQGLRYRNPSDGDGLWSARTVSGILNSRVYLGWMVQGKQRQVSYKIHQRRPVRPEEWYVVQDTHPAIITEELFQLVRQRAEQHGRAPQSSGKLYPMSGLVYCGECGRAMTRRKARGRAYYACRTHRDKGERGCSPHSVPESVLEGAVCAALEQEAGHLMRKLWLQQSRRESRAREAERREWEQARQKELEQLLRQTDQLYLDWKRGDLTREEYHRWKSRLTERRGQLSALQTAPVQAERNQETPSWLEYGLLHHLVERIWLEEDGSIRIDLSFVQAE